MKPPLSEATLRPLLRTRALGQSMEVLETTPSTNELAYQRGQSGAPHGHLVLADSQTKGRGRRGREWLSPPGLNLYLSVLLRPAQPPARAPELPLVVAVAVCETLRELGCQATLKWPNDVQIGGKKAAGILTELCAPPGRSHYVVVGIGLNANLTEAELPADLRDLATSVRLALQREVDRAPLCAQLLASLEGWLERHTVEGFEPARQRWRELSGMLGQPVRVRLEKGAVEGEAVDLDESGALLVRTAAGRVETIVAGDVELVRAR